MSASGIKVRRARPGETTDLTDMILRSKQSNGYDDDFMDLCREELSVSEEDLIGQGYWIAEDTTGTICGCARMRVFGNSQEGQIHAFFVSPDHQRQGIGRLLWRKLLELADQNNLEALCLDSDRNAVPFYEAMGFEVIGEAASGSIPGRKIPHMKMMLKR